ncbi:MAG: ThuA domain-containing protein [Cyclobacteriaceae bacterium]
MIHSRIKLSFFAICLFFSCTSQNEKLPELTYTGEEPRVQNPLSPEASQKHIQVPEGFEAVLFASEPDIINPIAFAWDEGGRLWVVQSQDYPHGLGNDVGGDRITICEDTNGDGRADKFTDYATEQSLTTGLVIVKGGIIVAQAPEIAFLEDTDGDDKMDKRTVLFGGFGTWDTHAGPANLKYGLDNNIWGSVGYSGFENEFEGKNIEFKMGVYRFSKDGKYFEPIGQFNNNTWGLGIREDFEIFGSTANNNHACYVGIPLRHYDYLRKKPTWAINSDFIQGHYEITSVDTIPLQQVDVRGGYTAAAGANFYTARNYPQEYQRQMYVNEPTGHLVHIARIVHDGAGYMEVDGGNIFASTDAWTAPVYTETGPDGNLWVADWYNPVIQHNPDRRGMDNQIWNDERGEGNAHINSLRDKGHGRIYIIRHVDGDDSDITEIDVNDNDALLEALQSDNMFWRTTAQRLIVENNKTDLIPNLLKLARDEGNSDASGFNGAAVHALWTLDGLGVLDGSNLEATKVVTNSLSSKSDAVRRAGLVLLRNTEQSSDELAKSGLLKDADLHIRLAAILRAGELPETDLLSKAIAEASKDQTNNSDKWLSAALKVYYRELNTDVIDEDNVTMLIPSAAEKRVVWRYTEDKPADNWYASDFDDSPWAEGRSPFGGKDMSKVKTSWSKSDIYMRREIDLNEIINEPVLKIMHDDNYDVYVNGQPLISENGVSEIYKYVKLDSALGQLFIKGKNVIAVHCHDNGGKQYIDAGIGKVSKPKADVVFDLNTVSQKMAFDRTVLNATVGQTVEIVLTNKDEMPHNLVVIEKGSLEAFGKMVDGFLDNPEAPKVGYVPNSRYVLAATEMIDPGVKTSIIFKLPNLPGRYPFVCTFPGHWRMMQGVIIVSAPGTYISDDPNAKRISMMGGGGSHDFTRFFGVQDGKFLSEEGKNTVTYTESSTQFGSWMDESDILYICNNKPLDQDTRKKIFSHVNAGKGLIIYHPGIWYNWKDWPEYNKELVGGGSKSHEKLQEFEVQVVKPNHPLMKGVPSKFRIIDELYRFVQDPKGTDVEVLAIGKGLESGEEFPVVWVVKHPKAKIVANTLGHDARAHDLKAYQTILKNTIKWVK